ncbi:MAG: helix-turn-helix transcriptional regulator [Actinomycetes bacterium]
MAERGWTFLTNHAHVLLFLTRTPDARVRDIAEAVGITERMVQLVLNDLEDAGYLVRRRVGRRNEYEVVGGPFRHPLEREHQVQELLSVLAPRR